MHALFIECIQIILRRMYVSTLSTKIYHFYITNDIIYHLNSMDNRAFLDAIHCISGHNILHHCV